MNFMPFYKSFEDSIDRLPEAEQLPAYKAITRYFFYQEEPQDLSLAASIIFDMAKPSLDRARKNAENGSKGAESRWSKRKK